MQHLEKRLDVRLLHRSTRGVALTDTGRHLFESLQPAFAGIDQALSDLDRERGSPSGRLRLHVSAGAAAAVIAPVWCRFLATYPRVQLDLELSDGPVDVVADGFDAAIAIRRFRRRRHGRGEGVGPLEGCRCRRAVLSRPRGEPVTPDDLTAHDCVQYRLDGALFPWPFVREGRAERSRYTVR